MDEEYIIVYINNQPYYMEASRYRDLAYIDNKLVNISNSSITLVSSFDYQNTTYPRITCSAMSQCRLLNSYSSSYIGVTDRALINDKFNFNILKNNNINTLIFMILFILLGVKLLWKK